MSTSGNSKTVDAGRIDIKDLAVRVLVWAVIILGFSFILRFIEKYLSLYQQALGACIFSLALYIVYKFQIFKRQPYRSLVLVLACFITVRYFIWRSTETLIYTGMADLIGMMLLFAAEGYTVLIHLMGLFLNLWPLKRARAVLPQDPSLYPTVDVFIPTYTEPADIVKITAIAASQIDYPKDKLRIHILDDGGTVARRNREDIREEVWSRYYDLKSFAAEYGIKYITREENKSAKAGNINHALTKTDGDLILVLDCDHIPTKDFLLNTVGHFLTDEKLFLVQTPHFFINPTPVEKNLLPITSVAGEGDMFYRIIHLGFDQWNSSYFCGSAAVLRRTFLLQIGGVSGQTITEDAETSFNLHSKGLNSVYVDRPMVCGLSPDTFDDYIVQRTRWAQGMMQVFILKNPLVAKGLSMAQRICYFNACFFWFFGLPRFIFYIAPACFLILGLKVYHASLMQILAFALPHVASTYIAMDYLYGEVRKPFFSEIYESVQSMFLMPAVLSALIHPEKPTFKITPKGKTLEKSYLNPLAATIFIVLLVNLGAMPLAAYRWFAYPMYRDVIVITGAWCIFNMFLAMASLGAFWESKQVRQNHRISSKGKAIVHFERLNETYECDIDDVSITGIGFFLPPGIFPREEDEIQIKVSDSYGNRYDFGARIHRVHTKRSRYFCGTEFVITKAVYPQVVSYVYGDSQRWLDTWDMQSRPSSTGKLLLFFVVMGAKGFKDSIHIISRVTRELISTYLVPRYRDAKEYYYKLRGVNV